VCGGQRLAHNGVHVKQKNCWHDSRNPILAFVVNKKSSIFTRLLLRRIFADVTVAFAC